MPAHSTASGHLIHTCEVCKRPASFGTGVSIRDGRLGKWWCGGPGWCRKEREGNAPFLKAPATKKSAEADLFGG